jgi:hypothetical protein
MTTQILFRRGIALIAAIPLLIPQAIFARDTAAADSVLPLDRMQLRPQDVALNSLGALAGEVFDSQGNPVPEEEVCVRVGQSVVARGMTNQQGKFEIPLQRGGLYLVSTKEDSVLVRAWKSTPPSHAARLIQLAPRNSTNVIRAQSPDGGLSTGWTLLILGGVATAIAVPVALHNSNDGRKSSRNNLREVRPATP